MQVELTAQLIDRRQTERQETSAEATYLERQNRVQVQITNLSSKGVRLTVAQPLFPGRRIWLKMPMLASREAVVIWVRGSEAGCEFNEVLHPMIVEAITRSHPRGE